MAKAREALAQSDIDAAVANERERCAWLCEQLAERWEKSAEKLRVDGSYTVRALWPPFKLVKCIKPRWSQAAKDTEAAAHGLHTVARGIREGWDSPERPAVDDFLSAAWRARMMDEIVAEEQVAVANDEAVHGVRFFSGAKAGGCYCDNDVATCREKGHDHAYNAQQARPREAEPHSVSGVATAIWPCEPQPKEST